MNLKPKTRSSGSVGSRLGSRLGTLLLLPLGLTGWISCSPEEKHDTDPPHALEDGDAGHKKSEASEEHVHGLEDSLEEGMEEVGGMEDAVDEIQKKIDGEVVYVSGLSLPQDCLSGAETAVTISGQMPNPLWKYQGCVVTHDESEDGYRVVLEPRALAPDPGTIAPQVLASIEEEVVIKFRKPGPCRIEVKTRGDDSMVEERVIHPGKPLVHLHQTGGFAGMDRSIMVSEDGQLWTWTGKGAARESELEDGVEVVQTLKELMSELKPEMRDSTTGAADLLRSVIRWKSGDQMHRIERDDANLSATERILLSELTSMWPEG